MSTEDLLAVALAGLDAPELDATFAERVRRRAAAELARSADEAPLALRLALSGALVPTVLVSAALKQATDTVRATAEIFGDSDKERED